MGLLDLFEKDQSVSMRFQPHEGTELPGYYELHRQEITTGAMMLIAGLLIIAAVYYRSHLYKALIFVLASILRMNRKTVAKARLLWADVEKRAD